MSGRGCSNLLGRSWGLWPCGFASFVELAIFSLGQRAIRFETGEDEGALSKERFCKLNQTKRAVSILPPLSLSPLSLSLPQQRLPKEWARRPKYAYTYTVSAPVLPHNLNENGARLHFASAG